MKVSVETAKIVHGESAVELSIRLEGVQVLPRPLGDTISVVIEESGTPGYVNIKISPSSAVLLWTRYYVADGHPPPMPTKTATAYEDSEGTMNGPMDGSSGSASVQTVALGPNQCMLVLAWALFADSSMLVMSQARLCHSSSSSSSSLASSSSSSPSPAPLSSSSVSSSSLSSSSLSSSSSPSPLPSSSQSSSSSSSQAAQSSSSGHP
jgi:hypothetical protein